MPLEQWIATTKSLRMPCPEIRISTGRQEQAVSAYDVPESCDHRGPSNMHGNCQLNPGIQCIISNSQRNKTEWTYKPTSDVNITSPRTTLLERRIRAQNVKLKETSMPTSMLCMTSETNVGPNKTEGETDMRGGKDGERTREHPRRNSSLVNRHR